MRVLKRALAVSAFLPACLGAQRQPHGAAELREMVTGLGVTMRVLMIGAHPDDEDTQLITYLAKARHVETAYLSLTRGDGGQNLIGDELGPALGVIRTEELLAARRIDGGRQYFTRAYDFGFSKTLDETAAHWPKDSILQDMVAIVRAFRPHVIIAVFTGTPSDGHGHHQFSGVLAREVFDAAADSVRFPPSRVGGLPAWSAAKFYRLRRGLGDAIRVNVGAYDAFVGRTYSEIATESRSQHRSQGQGALSQRGPRFDGAQLEVSRVSDVAHDASFFDGLDTSWSRFKALPLTEAARAAVDSLVAVEPEIRRTLDVLNPSAMVPALAAYVRLVTRASAGVTCAPLDRADSVAAAPCAGAFGDLSLSLASALRRSTTALRDAAGLTVEATAPRPFVAERDSVPVTIAVYNEGKNAVSIDQVRLAQGPGATAAPRQTVLPDSAGRQTLFFRADTSPTAPWWLRRPMQSDMFQQPLHEMVVGEDRVQDTGAEVTLNVGGTEVLVGTGPIVYRFADRARGEMRRELAVVPELSVTLDHDVEYARANAPFDRTVAVHVRSGAAAPRDVDVSLILPPGVAADTATRHVTLAAFGRTDVYFHLHGTLAAGRVAITAAATSAGRESRVGFIPIDYEHIRLRRLYRPSTVQIEAVRTTVANLRVGYVRGVSDNVLPMLEELGIPATELDPAKLSQADLSRFTTIVLGPRAYEADSATLLAATPRLLRFARDGGTIVTQYGQLEMAQPGILPYPVAYAGRLADRVTDENASVRVLAPQSPLLTSPNKIDEQDFQHWVQERAVYMPRTFDARYQPVLSMNDPGDPPNNAGILIAPVGRGTYVYTTLSFFRQLPNGNPGAARLFVNLLSAGHRTRPSTSIP